MRKVWAIVRKDLSLEKRNREMISSMAVLALIAILLFRFSFDLQIDGASQVAPGALWVAIAFAGTLGLARSFVMERDQGCLDGLLLCPVDRSVLYMGKMLGNLLFISMAVVAILAPYLILFNLPFRPLLLAVILLGSAGFSAVGTLVSAMAVHARAREVLLPVLLFPLVMPALIAAVRLTGGILDGQAWAEMRHWMQLLAGFDVILTAVSYMTFDYVVEE